LLIHCDRANDRADQRHIVEVRRNVGHLVVALCFSLGLHRSHTAAVDEQHLKHLDAKPALVLKYNGTAFRLGLRVSLALRFDADSPTFAVWKQSDPQAIGAFAHTTNVGSQDPVANRFPQRLLLGEQAVDQFAGHRHPEICVAIVDIDPAGKFFRFFTW